MRQKTATALCLTAPDLVATNVKIPVDIMKSCAYHSLEEYSNLAVVLPRLYEMYHDIPDKIEDYIC